MVNHLPVSRDKSLIYYLKDTKLIRTYHETKKG